MSQNIPMSTKASVTDAATPANTPLNVAPISSRGQVAEGGRPTVTTVDEEEEGGEQQGGEQGGLEGGNPASVLARNPALLSMVQDRLSTLVGRPSGYVEQLPPQVKKRITGLKGIQQQHAKIENEFQLEILELEKKFAARYAPLYDRRFAIISGTEEPNAEELQAGEAAEAEEREEDEDDEDEEEPSARVTELDESGEAAAAALKGVPEFWLVALKNHNIIGEQITERDEEALRHLTDIRLEYLDTKQAGFRLAFHFSPNDFFEDKVLTKTYYYQEEVGYGGDFVYDRAVGCDIKWKEDKDLTKRVEIKKQRNKNTNRTRVVKKVVPTDSFFNFFKPPQPPSVDALEAGEVDEQELEDLDERLEVDYQVGEDLKERVIPRAVDYFTGKALDYEDDMEDFEDEDEDDFDEDSEDDDDEDRRPAPAPASSQDPQECKQQ